MSTPLCPSWDFPQVSEALAYLLPGEVKGLLRELLCALPSANQSSAAEAATDPSATAAAEADAESGAISNTTGSDDALTDDRSPERSGSTSPERSAERSGNTSQKISRNVTSPGPSSERSPTRREISGKKTSQERSPTIPHELSAESSRDFSSSPAAPLVVQGLDRSEADYLRRGAERVLRQWGRAEKEGWAEVRGLRYLSERWHPRVCGGFWRISPQPGGYVPLPKRVVP